MTIVWRVRGKIIKSVLCSIVCNNCAQCNEHIYERASWFLRPDCAPQFGMPPVRIRGMMQTQHLWIRTSVVDCRCTTPPCRQYCCCTLWSAEGCWNGKLQNVAPPSLLFEWSRIFFIIHRRHRCKKMMDQNFEIRILYFSEFFEIFKKASHGPYAADLGHYGCCQSRSK